jgi:hypothetical protein
MPARERPVEQRYVDRKDDRDECKKGEAGQVERQETDRAAGIVVEARPAAGPVAGPAAVAVMIVGDRRSSPGRYYPPRTGAKLPGAMPLPAPDAAWTSVANFAALIWPFSTNGSYLVNAV